jgi:hypothetical protein
MNNNPIKTPFLVLRCDGGGQASDAAVAVVEGMFKSVIRDFEEIIEDGVSGAWMDESYATKAQDYLDEKNPGGVAEDTVEAAALEAEELMSKLMVQNHHALQNMSGSYLVDEVAVLRRFPNLWVVQVFGSKFPF